MQTGKWNVPASVTLLQKWDPLLPHLFTLPPSAPPRVFIDSLHGLQKNPSWDHDAEIIQSKFNPFKQTQHVLGICFSSSMAFTGWNPDSWLTIHLCVLFLSPSWPRLFLDQAEKIKEDSGVTLKIWKSYLPDFLTSSFPHLFSSILYSRAGNWLKHFIW